MAAFTLSVLLGLLWAARSTGAYRRILIIWGVDVFDFPFLDTETMLSGARCLRAGIDVYVANPCDTLGRVYDYSPLWMLIARAPVTIAWGTPIGIAIALLYCGAVALLPAARAPRHVLAMTLGAVSTVAAFAVERGNNDVVLFTLAACAAALACRSPAFRILGYCFALLAGLLKYYPLALMALAARERPARLAAITAAAILPTALFVTLAWGDLTRALGLIPTGDYFGGMFGSIQVAGGISTLIDGAPPLIPLIRWTMSAAALGLGARLSFRVTTVEAIAALPLRERAFLLAGGLLTLGCFFTAQNIGYRAIHLLLTLPALLALRGGGSKLFYPAPALVLALLWSDCWRRGLLYVAKLIGPDSRPFVALLGWMAREALWWWLIALLAACVFGLLRRSTLLGPRAPLWA
ncbi:hypothetical protein FHS31_000383 [Sphingomonas vulcanisoli]|uniref:DUF2029 domain-containing protein n=1 Tax=Sphingomonas vulcanisoli TaxID=1658060 RepID=A0ABX0TMY6_9SPHN|nr:hypothetical protein [Sphingomonas vulcanisoli]NIJ06801.1 hypothetical protein [Sphingomonas vulcanisoli]